MTEDRPDGAMLPIQRDPNLIVTRAAMQYTMPSRPMACPICSRPQLWWMSTDRYLSRRPDPVSPQLADPTDVPARPNEPSRPVLFEQPPGWGLVQCRYCSALLALTLRRMPAIGVLSPPALIEVSTVKLNFSAVQVRLSDDSNSSEERWRLAFVSRQHDRQTLDLSVKLLPSDPEYHEALITALKVVEVRIDDHPDTGAERWRTAIVADILSPHVLSLTCHFDAADPEGQAFKRFKESSRGERIGQWRYPSLPFDIQHTLKRARRGERIGQWLPIKNT